MFTFQNKGVTSIIKSFLLFFLLYLFIFSPSFIFLPFAGSRFVIVFALLYISLKKSWGGLIGAYKVELTICFAFLLHSLFFKIIYGEALFMNRYILIFIQLFICSYALSLYAIKNNLNLNHFLITVTAVAVLFSCLAFFFPAIHDLFYSILKISGTSYEEFEDRGYGFGNDLLFTYSIAIAVGMCLLLNKSNRNKYYLFLVPFFLLAMAINARVSLAVILSFILVKNMGGVSVKLITNGAKFLLVCLLFIYGLYSNGILVEQLDFVGLMFFWTYNLITGDGSIGHFALIFGDFLFWPEGWLPALFGNGIDVFKGDYQRSDVGYVIQVNYGGIFYLLLIFILFLNICLKNIFNYNKNSPERFICYTFLLSSILINLKGYYFSYNPGISIFTLLMCHYHLQRPRKNNVKNLV